MAAVARAAAEDAAAGGADDAAADGADGGVCANECGARRIERMRPAGARILEVAFTAIAAVMIEASRHHFGGAAA